MADAQQGINHIPTVLCVELGESAFAASKELSSSGQFRVVTATKDTTALSALSVIPVDAVVFSTAALAEDTGKLAQRMREIAPAVPHVVVHPSSELKEISNAAGLIYIAQIQRLVPLLRAAIQKAQTTSEHLIRSVEQARQLSLRQRQLREELASRRSSLRQAVRRNENTAEMPAFTRVSLKGNMHLSACTHCRAVVAIADSPAGLERGERAHRCPKPPA